MTSIDRADLQAFALASQILEAHYGGMSREEAEARARRLLDPRFTDAIAEARAHFGGDVVFTDVELGEDGVHQITIAPATTVGGAERPTKRDADPALADLRKTTARFEVERAFGRRNLTALPLLWERGLYVPKVFWEALNPHRYEELERQRAAKEARESIG